MSARNVLDDWPESRLADYLLGWRYGYLEGVDRGRQLADEEAAARHRAAAGVVLAMTKVPERDHTEDERRAQKSADWWAEKRGERRTA